KSMTQVTGHEGQQRDDGRVRELAHAARAAGRELAALAGPARAELLRDLAGALAEPGERGRLLAANARDVAAAKAAAAKGELDPARLKRLGLDAAKLDSVS